MIGRRLALLAAFALVFAAGCEKNDQNLYESAEKMMQQNKYDEAVNKLRFLVSEYPDSRWASKAYFRLGEIDYLFYKKPEAALDSFVRAAEKDKKGQIGLEAQKHIADIYLNHLRNHELAILQYQKILKDFGGKVKADEFHFLIGKAYFMKHDYKQAIIEFKNLMDSFPESQLAPDALYHTALCHFISGEPDKAAVLYQEIIKKYHHGKYDYDSRLGLGMSYEEMEKLDKALEVYKRMAAQYPDKQLVARKIESVTARMNSGKRE